jgi:uncharacterized membrane protein
LNPHVAALLLGLVAGLRTFTPPAVLWLMRFRSPAAYALGAVALLELAADLYPKTPARTAFFGLTARILSGAFCGWMVSAAGGSPWANAGLGAIGAIAGAYLGLAGRTSAIAVIGGVPAALLEDAVAIGAAVAIVSAI